MKRRDVLRTAAALGAGASLGAPAASAQSARERTLRVAPLTALASVDTVFNTSLVTTNHGYAAYDTLFGFTGRREITPQMAEGHVVEDDGRTYVIRLREGLRFHTRTC